MQMPGEKEGNLTRGGRHTYGVAASRTTDRGQRQAQQSNTPLDVGTDPWSPQTGLKIGSL